MKDDNNGQIVSEEITETPVSKKKVRRKADASRSRGKNRRPDSGRFMIAQLLAMVCLVLVVFEGKVMYTLFTHKVGNHIEVMSSRDSSEGEDYVESTENPDASAAASDSTGSSQLGLAGAGSGGSTVAADSGVTQIDTSNPEAINSPAVVPTQRRFLFLQFRIHRRFKNGRLPELLWYHAGYIPDRYRSEHQ